MLARLQRRLIALLGLAVAASLALCVALGYPGLGVAIALLLAFGYTLVLAVEFVPMALVHGDDPAPRAAPGVLLKAWWTECVVALWVFGWLQPFRERARPDVPGRRGVRGIVFVHGYLCNRAIWNPWLAHCARLGIPCVAVSLEPVFKFMASSDNFSLTVHCKGGHAGMPENRQHPVTAGNNILQTITHSWG